MRTIKLILIVMMLLFSTGCAIYHHYGEFTGRVVDAEMKEPLEGAAVLAVYYTQQYGLAGSSDNYLDAQEAVTDRNGEFKISSLNAFAFRPLQSFEPYVWFTIFKPGYGCYPRHKQAKPMFLPNGTLPSDRYVTIELPKLASETIADRLRNATCLPSPSVPEDKYKKLRSLLQSDDQLIGH